ncbi:hypothetical protein JCM8097_007758 [Rhodosporidiobolus ruineniae]
MRFLAPLLLSSFAVLAELASALPAAPRALTTYAPPSSDPFYDAPAGFEDQANGAVLKTRQVSTSLDLLAKSTYQLLYRTTNSLEDPTVTVTTVYAPRVPASPPRVLLVMAPTDSANVDCAPSWAVVAATNASLYNVATVYPDIIAALSKGWYVSLPDHLGETASFIDGKLEGFAGIDGLRALLNHKPTIASTVGYQAAVKGYSGGGHACGWVAQYLPTYGAGLNVVGAACGGTVVNLRTTLDKISNGHEPFTAFSPSLCANSPPSSSLFSTFALSAVAGLANGHPDLNSWVNENVYPNGTAALAYARTDASCVIPGPFSVNPYVGTNVYSLIKGGEAALDDEIPARVLAMGNLGEPTSGTYATNGVLQVPTFLYHSRSDEIVPFDPIPSYFASQCAQGAKITLSTTAVSEHATAYFEYLGAAIQFIEDRFNGVELSGCSESNTVLLPLFSADYVKAIGQNALKFVKGLSGKTLNGEKLAF